MVCDYTENNWIKAIGLLEIHEVIGYDCRQLYINGFVAIYKWLKNASSD